MTGGHMITNANPGVILPNIENQMKAELYGLSSDTKPVQEVPNGSTFVEMNTGKVFFFNAKTKTWVEFNA